MTNQKLANLREELKLTDQSFTQVAQVLSMTLIMIHSKYVANIYLHFVIIKLN